MASTCSGAIEVSTVVRGYHVYKDIWTAPLGEILYCLRETDNRHDRFAVAIIKDGEVVGHVRKEISSICSVFLLSGTISCEVTGSRQYSRDLEQGGMHIPCKLRFTCSTDEELMQTTRKLLDLALKKIDSERPLKKIKLEPVETSAVLIPSSSQVSHPKAVSKDEVVIVSDQPDFSSGSKFSFLAAENVDPQWVKIGRTTLLDSHKEMILRGNQLDDTVISFAQKLLKKQFPNINGLQNPLLQNKKQMDGEKTQRLQVVHCRSSHWILASTIHNDDPDKVLLYDSLYDNVDAGTLAVIRGLFGPAASPEIVEVQKQRGTADCGVFAVAFGTAICFKQQLNVHFNQELMRHHLVQCFEKSACLPFPLVQIP